MHILDHYGTPSGTPTPDYAELAKPLRVRLSNHPKVKPFLPKLAAAQAEYRETIKKLEPFRSPRDWQKVAAELVESAKTPDEFEALLIELAKSGGAQLVKTRAEAMAKNALQDLAKQFDAFLVACREAVAELHKEATDHEKRFFQAFNLPPERTAVTRRLDAMDKHIDHWVKSVAGVYERQDIIATLNGFSHILDYLTP